MTHISVLYIAALSYINTTTVFSFLFCIATPTVIYRILIFFSTDFRIFRKRLGGGLLSLRS